jgi:hypothetical protein
MVGRGILNIAKGVGKSAGGVLLYATSGASTVASSGTGTPLAVLGFIGAGVLVSNGSFQATVGAAEVLAGFATPKPIALEIQNSVPESLTEVVAITADSIISSAAGKPSTTMQSTAEVVDTLQELAIPTPGGKAGAVIERLIFDPDVLDKQSLYLHQNEN